MHRLTINTLVVLLRSLLVRMTKEVNILPNRPQRRANSMTMAPRCKAVDEGRSEELELLALRMTLLLLHDSVWLML